MPAHAIIERVTAHDFYSILRFSRKEQAKVDALPDIERTTIWCLWGHGNIRDVRGQRLLRTHGENSWCANDLNPTWLGQIPGTPWFATAEEAEAAL
ncbi:MAG: hypothetical protein LC793_18520 [Thermomicrobia bacterium]|nr:hypothetical protein [Thermomicrobia bacterium]